MGRKTVRCIGCGEEKDSSNIWKHYRQYIRLDNPRQPDDEHTEEAIQLMREMEADKALRLLSQKASDRKQRKVVSNHKDWAKHGQVRNARRRDRRTVTYGREMCFERIKENAESQAHKRPYLTEPVTSFPGLVQINLPINSLLACSEEELFSAPEGSLRMESVMKVPGQRELEALRPIAAERGWMQMLENAWAIWITWPYEQQLSAVTTELVRTVVRSRHLKVDAGEVNQLSELYTGVLHQQRQEHPTGRVNTVVAYEHVNATAAVAAESAGSAGLPAEPAQYDVPHSTIHGATALGTYDSTDGATVFDGWETLLNFDGDL